MNDIVDIGETFEIYVKFQSLGKLKWKTKSQSLVKTFWDF